MLASELRGRGEAAPGGSAFGTSFVGAMAVARWRAGLWDGPQLEPLAPLQLHPGSHVLHYGSACFEGLKAHRGGDDTVRLFRLDAHVERLRGSAGALLLPAPPRQLLADMVLRLVRSSLAEVPEAPGALYVRPTLIGTEANIGSASQPSNEALLFVVASPVGDYFAGGPRPLVLALESGRPRTTPQLGRVKAGANYAMAAGSVAEAGHRSGADQVLFAPGGEVQETGASNFLLLDEQRLITPLRTGAFLHGVTLDSVLQLAARLGYRVEERPLHPDEVLAWAARPEAEAALSGTAAVLAGVGEIVHAGGRARVGTGEVGPHTRRLRSALVQLQRGELPDPDGWLTAVLE